MRYWVIQQSSKFSVLASEEYPDLTVPEGEKRKVARAGFATSELATGKAKEWAAEQFATFVE